jgi:hypothetical protein
MRWIRVTSHLLLVYPWVKLLIVNIMLNIALPANHPMEGMLVPRLSPLSIPDLPRVIGTDGVPADEEGLYERTRGRHGKLASDSCHE